MNSPFFFFLFFSFFFPLASRLPEKNDDEFMKYRSI